MSCKKICDCLLLSVIALFLSGFFSTSSAAQFKAEVVIDGPGAKGAYKLNVGEKYYRIQKTKGFPNMPSYPMIIDRATGVTWGLNTDTKQYVVIETPNKTAFMNPLVGWELTRGLMKENKGPIETVKGHKCRTFIYTLSSRSQPAGKMWYSQELDHVIKDERYGANQKAVLELMHIKLGDQDEDLFKLPSGYVQIDPDTMEEKEAKARKGSASVKKQKTMVENLVLPKGYSKGRSLRPDRRIVITATGDHPKPSAASMVIKNQDNQKVKSVRINLTEGQTQSWVIPPEMQPYTLSLSGYKGQIKFKIEQEPAAQKAASDQGKPSSGPSGPSKKHPQDVRPAAGKIVFILDASGSMWGRVEGKPKITIAKEVLSGLIKQLHPKSSVGLVAYGHRRKGDCDDVEELIPLGPLDKIKTIKIINGLTPKGKTPISRSVKMTAERLKQMEDEVTIALVSDGIETCDPDPCGLIKKLKNSGIKFVMHVIGFDVGEEGTKQLACMAKAGGGMYYTARNAGEFLAAAREVVEAPTFKGGFLTVKTLKNGKPYNARAEVFLQRGHQRMGGKSTWYREQPAVFKLRPGVYSVRALDHSVKPVQIREIRDIEITPGQSVEKSISFGGHGLLRITALKNGKPFKARAEVYIQNTNKGVGGKSTWYKNKPAEYKLLPDVYYLRVLDNSARPPQVKEIRDIKIVSGEEIEKKITFGGSGLLRITALKNGKPFKARAEVYIQNTNKGVGAKSTWYKNKPAEYKLLPDVYYLRVLDNSARPPQIKEIRDIKIVSGEEIEKKITFGGSGLLRITALKNGKPFKARAEVYIQNTNKGVGGKSTWYKNQPAEYKLLPDVYYIRVIDHSARPVQMKEIRDIEITAGKEIEKTVTFETGGILRITATKDGQPFEARVSVYRQSDRKGMGDKNTWYRKKPAEYKLLPEVYFIKVTDNSTKPVQVKEIRGIEIASGAEVEKTVAFEAGGTLRIKAVKDGQPFEARVNVYRQEDGKRIGGQNTWYRKKPAEFRLLPGVYYMIVLDPKTKAKKEIRGINIQSGQTTEQVVDF